MTRDELDSRFQGIVKHYNHACEKHPIFAAFCSGNYEEARYEVLDAIAVLLRMDDMIKERQEETK